MLVKFDVSDEFADELKAITGHNTASKAFQHAATHYAKHVEYIEYLQSVVSKLQDSVRAQRDVIESARSAAVQLAERTAQEDLFIDQPFPAPQRPVRAA